MFFQTVVVLGLVVFSHAQKGHQRPRRQAPGIYERQYNNGTSPNTTAATATTTTTISITLSSSTFTISSTSDSTTSQSVYTSPGGYSVSSISTPTSISASPSSSGVSQISAYSSPSSVSTSAAVSTYVTVSASSAAASSYTSTTFPYIPGTGPSSYGPSSIVSPLPSGYSKTSVQSSSSVPSQSSSGSSPVGSVAIPSSSATSSSAPTSTESPSEYSPTHFSYAPAGTGATAYSPSAAKPVPSGYSLPGYQSSPGTGPSYYGPLPVGPETSSPSASGSYGSPTSVPATYNASTSAAPTGTGYSSSSTATNATCSGATLNVLGASLDWWYTETYTYAVSTFSIESNSNGSSTGWTLAPASTTFDVSSAVAAPSCAYSVVNGTSGNSTYSYYDGVCYPTPAPVAASTTVVSIAAYTSLNKTTGNGTIPDAVVTPPPAVITIPSNSSSGSSNAGSFSAGTPFVYFSAYEIMTQYSTTFDNGSTGCAASTSVYNMSEPFSFEYTGNMQLNGLLEVNAGVTGDVNPAFLGVVNQTSAVVAGSWVAAPTVVVVVEKVLAAEPEAALSLSATAIPSPATASVLKTITPTLPAGFQTVGTSDGGSLSGVGVTIRVESTQPVLLLPTSTTTSSADISSASAASTACPAFRCGLRTFFAIIASSDSTLILPTPTDAQTITTNIGGIGEVTATAIEDVNPALTSDSGSSSGGSGSEGSGSEGSAGSVGTTTVAFVGKQGSSDVTLEVAVPSTQNVVTANFNGATVTATRAPAQPAQDTGAAGATAAGGLGNLISAVNSAAQPTNALQVLSEAQSQAGNPTAGAIVAGLGGSSTSGGGGGEPAGDSGSNSGSAGGSSGSGSGSSSNGGSGSSGNGGSGDSGTGSASNGASGSGSNGGNSGSNAGVNNGGSSGSASGSGLSGSTSQNGGSDSGSSSGSSDGNGPGSSSDGSSGQQAAAPAPVITVAGSTVTANPTPAFVVDGQTVLPGGSPITVNGETIAVPASTNAIVVDGSTIPLAGAITSSTVFDINGIPITANPDAAFPIDGQTLEAGGSPITVDGSTLSLAPGATAVVVNGKTSIISQQTPGAAANIPLLTVGSQTFTANAATQFSLGPGATLTPGGVVTISGSTISLESGATGVVINGKTETLDSPAVTPAPLVTVGGTVYQANAGSTYDIGGSLLTPGGVITVSGSTISLASGASDIVINGQTEALNLPAITSAPQVTIGGQVYSANGGSTFDIGSQLLTPGGVITIDGSTISLASGASDIVVNGVTTTLNGAGSQTAPNSNHATITAPPVLTVDGQAFGANGGTSYVISGKTLTPGGAITISGPNGVETISLNSAADELFSIVSGTTMTSMIGAMGAMATGAPVLTIDGQTYSAVSYDTGSGPTYVIDGQTLTRGGEITITAPNGGLETILLEAAGTAIDIISDGHTLTSTIAGALNVMPTAAPILTIDGEQFTAIGNGATYIIDGKTLTTGEIETVTISGHTFVISLAPGATLLEIETVGPNGQLTGTMFETLFPAQMTRGTVTNTILGGATQGAQRTSGAVSATSGAKGGPNANLQSGATPHLAFTVSGVALALGSLVFAVCL